MNSSILIAMALEVEGQGVFEKNGVPVLYTGLGKVNAAYRLAREIAMRRAAGNLPRLVLNFGSAGSHVFPTHALVACRRFVQRDMDARPLGFALGQTPFEDTPLVLEHPPVFAGLPEALCGSGDRFETAGSCAMNCEVIDMEAYALAKICLLEGIAFGCAKYITDGADSSAASDWEGNLPKAAEGYWGVYEKVRKGIG